MDESLSQSVERSWKLYVAITLSTWVLLTHQGLITAIEVWTISDVFNHCYIVLPASFYLIWEKRKEIHWSETHITLLPFPLLIGEICVYLFGMAGDIQVFMHIATFTMLPTLIWMLVGNKVAKQMLFPLVFMLFAIPIGEELVPFLQEITADFSVMLLDLTGIPLFRSGLYIEIPQGKFLVAEACSGISFLIASIVLGNLYAYMNLKTWKARIFFVALSVLFPIAANVIRVYGIIIIGYLSDMEHAVGADHLIYGWFFFAFVLVCLFLIGELIRKRESKTVGNSPQKQANHAISAHSFHFVSVKNLALLTIMLIAIVKLTTLQNINEQERAENMETIELTTFEQINTPLGVVWSPEFIEPSLSINEHYRVNGIDFSLFFAYYSYSGGELISSLNKLYSEDRWSLVARDKVLVNGIQLNQSKMASARAEYMRVYSVYLINDEFFASSTKAKLYETWQKFLGKQTYSSIIALGIRGEKDDSLFPQEEQAIEQTLNVLANKLNKEQK